MKITLNALFLYLFVCFASIGYSQTSTGFVRLDQNNEFRIGENLFYPKMVNYGVWFIKDSRTPNTYYLSPHASSTDIGGTPTTGGLYRQVFDILDDDIIARANLIEDLDNMKLIGINTIRLYITGYDGAVASGVRQDNLGNVNLPGGSFNMYASQMEDLLSLCSDRDIYVIWVLGKPHMDVTPSGKKLLSGKFQDEWRDYLNSVGSHFKNNKAILAYDIYNEIHDEYYKHNEMCKLLITNWVADWYYALKNKAPNQMITIGSDKPNKVFESDHEMHMVDFVNIHLYENISDNVSKQQNSVANWLYWMGNTCVKPWIVGEAGYSGTDEFDNQSGMPFSSDAHVGTRSDQAAFGSFFLDRARDCGCKGTAWWQFSDVHAQGVYHDFFGIYQKFSTISTSKAPKPMTTVILNHDPSAVVSSNCTRPGNYFNLNSYTKVAASGNVVDINGNPIENAVVSVNDYSTFTDYLGNFILHIPSSFIPSLDLYISAPGYSISKQPLPSASMPHFFANIVLETFSHNLWQKRWTNAFQNSFQINSRGRKFVQHYKGDFDGDGADELLQIDPTTYPLLDIPKTFNLALFSYETKASNSNNHLDFFKTIWEDRAGNGESRLRTALGHSTYETDIQKFLGPYYDIKIGDFDGDGKDNIFVLNDTHMAVLSFNGTSWVPVWSANRSSIHMDLYSSALSVGDFNGDGKDDILGHPSTGWMTIFEFNSIAGWEWGYWTNAGVNYQVYNYRDNLLVGDFNGDGQDDVFGFDNTSCAMFSINSYNQFVPIWNSTVPNHMMMGYKDKIIVGNFDSDPNDELLGYGSWATKFDYEDNDMQWDWSTYSDCRIVDYNTHFSNPSDKLFFYRPYAHMPDNLMVMKTYGRFDMYAMTKRILNEESLVKGKRSDVLLSNEVNNISEESGINIYPNPNSGTVYFMSSTEELVSKIELYSVTGTKIYSIDVPNQISGNFRLDPSFSDGLYIFKIYTKQGVRSKRILLRK